MITVLIVDDEPRIRSSLRLLVDSEADMTVVAEAVDGQDGVELAVDLDPDVILMDIRMPRMTGIDAIRLLAERNSRSRVIVLTTFDLDEYVVDSLRAGASGFLVKNSPPREVLHAIRVVHEGDALLSPAVTKRVIGRFAPMLGDDRVQALTAREVETLVLIGRGCSNAEIAAELFVTVTTVRTYVSRILAKLHARDRAGLVVIAYESGLVTPRFP
ncbi:response regulator transcription factor [Agromyces atrinae]|uniref:response regulator transcription factor n=1 Tax=Agromyces atrinae TaxID=592376 RepID=UPI001F59BA84|nr:response regulator transcription factor [Agromyces atrinae]MCI2958725.1 response regulator transcription factor [Agromyces atrinae]